ncbi:MAG: hypothetical protein AB8F74_12960 [Saprospiraceae bacterium]
MDKIILIEWEKFYRLSVREQQQILKTILEKANNDKSAFVKFFRSLDYGTTSNRMIFYEAIWKNPVGWEDFLLGELNWLINTAERKDEKAIEELSSIFYIVAGKGLSSDFYNNATKILEPRLASEIPKIRETALEGIIEISKSHGKGIDSQLVNKLEKQLTDKEFDIRLYAYYGLKEFKLLPNNFQLSFKDKLQCIWKGYKY